MTLQNISDLIDCDLIQTDDDIHDLSPKEIQELEYSFARRIIKEYSFLISEATK